jgi:hypothetical protein
MRLPGMKMWYSDDLGDTWYKTDDPDHIAPPGSDNTTNSNYDVIRTAGFPWAESLGYAYCSCFHKNRFWMFKGGRVQITTAGHNYWRQAWGAWSLPLDFETSLLKSKRVLTLSEEDNVESGYLFDNTKVRIVPSLEVTVNKQFPTHCASFSDHILVGFGVQNENSALPSGVFDVRTGDSVLVWDHMDFDAAWSLDIDETDPQWATYERPPAYYPKLNSCGICQYRNQVWVIGGTDYGWTSEVSKMRNRIKTSIDGKTWHLVRFTEPDPEDPFIDNPPAYPTAGFQNVPVRSLDTSACFFSDAKELLLGFCWTGHDYYNDLLGYIIGGNIAPRQMSLFMNFMHSQTIPFPEDIPVETPWYNFPIGGEPGTAPDAPGESTDFTATGDIFRCLRIDLEGGSITAGSGFPFVSSLQSSSPTALPGQIPDKMLAGDKNGYLNKAMVRECAGLGGASKYVLWTIGSNSANKLILYIDVTTRQSYLPAGFLIGLPIRIFAVDGTYTTHTILTNGNDTITLTAPLAADLLPGTQCQIAPMDCAALLAEDRYQFPARLVQLRINVANYQDDEQSLKVGIRRAAGPRRFGEYDTDTDLIQTITQRQLEAGGGVVGISPHASRSLSYDLRVTPNGGGTLEIGPIRMSENIQPGEGGVS